MPVAFLYTESTNTIVVTGGTSAAPADFPQFVTKDRATAASLLSAWTPNSNTKVLTYQVRPVELLALLISFVVASKTTETDYIFITGTDWLGAAQTEVIDVSAGNGTYVSTKYWRTITNIDCSDSATGSGTVWANGTVAVTQPILGVVWNKGNGQFQLDCILQNGDGTTATYFKIYLQQIRFICAVTWGLVFKANATFRAEASSLYYYRDTYAPDNSATCVVILRDLEIHNDYYNPFLNFAANATVDIDRLVMSLSGMCLTGGGPNTVITDVNSKVGTYGLALGVGATLSRIRLFGKSRNIYISGGSGISNFYDVIAEAGSLYDVEISSGFTGTGFVGDSVMGTAGVWAVSWVGTGTGSVYRWYTFSLRVSNILDTSIAEALITLKDAAGNTVFSELTGAGGTVAFVGQDSNPAANAVTHTRYYYSGAPVVGYKGPWTLTITKAGYQDYQDVITIDRKMDLEVAMLAPAGGVIPTYMGLVPLGVKQAVI